MSNKTNRSLSAPNIIKSAPQPRAQRPTAVLERKQPQRQTGAGTNAVRATPFKPFSAQVAGVLLKSGKSDTIPKLVALTGSGARVDATPMLDMAANEYLKEVLTEKLDLVSVKQGVYLLRVEACDEVGATPLDASIVRPKAALDKMGRLLSGYNFVARPRFSVWRIGSATGEPLILTRTRALMVVDKDEVERFRREVGHQTLVQNSFGIRPVRVKQCKLADTRQAVEWLCAIPTQAYAKASGPDIGDNLDPCGAYTTVEMIRLAEILSLLDVRSMLTGSGTLKPLVQSARTKLAANQKARSDKGVQPPADWWAEWYRFRQDIGQSAQLPLRLDIPLKTPRAKPKPKRTKIGPPKKPLSAFAKRMEAQQKARVKRVPLAGR